MFELSVVRLEKLSQIFYHLFCHLTKTQEEIHQSANDHQTDRQTDRKTDRRTEPGGRDGQRRAKLRHCKVSGIEMRQIYQAATGSSTEQNNNSKVGRSERDHTVTITIAVDGYKTTVIPPQRMPPIVQLRPAGTLASDNINLLVLQRKVRHEFRSRREGKWWGNMKERHPGVCFSSPFH